MRSIVTLILSSKNNDPAFPINYQSPVDTLYRDVHAVQCCHFSDNYSIILYLTPRKSWFFIGKAGNIDVAYLAW